MFALGPAPGTEILDPRVGTSAFLPHKSVWTQSLVALSVQDIAVKVDALHLVWSLGAVGMVGT